MPSPECLRVRPPTSRRARGNVTVLRTSDTVHPGSDWQSFLRRSGCWVYDPISRDAARIAAEVGVAPRRISFIAALQFIQNFWLVGAAMAPARIPLRLRELRRYFSQYVLPPRRPNGSIHEP